MRPPAPGAQWALAGAILGWPLVAAWPLPLRFTTDILAAPDQEAATHIWGHWAAWTLGRVLDLQTTLMAWPDGVELLLIDPLNAWVAGPATALWGPAVGYNLLLYIGLVVAGCSGALLARTLDAPPLPAAMLAATCPTLLANAADGMTEGFLVGLVGCQLALVVRASRGGQRTALLGAAVCLGATAWTGPYNAVWALTLDGAWLGWSLARRDRAGAKSTALAMLMGGVLMAPVAHGIFTRRADSLPGGTARAGLPEIVDASQIFRGGVRTGADMLDLWLPGPLTGGEADPSHTAYLGLGVLILATVAAARDRRLRPWLAAALTMAALALGPWLYWKGTVVEVLGRPLAGPAGVLMLLVSPLARLTRWYRAAAVASLLLAPLAARALTHLPRPLRLPVFVVILADLLLLAPMSWPLHHTPPPAPWPIEGPGAVLELPPVTTGQPPSGAWRDVGALAQVQHGRPVGGSFMNLGQSQAARAATARLREGFRDNTVSETTLTELQGSGFRWVAVHRRHFTMPERSIATLKCSGLVVVDTADALVVDLTGPRGAECAGPTH